MSGSVVLTWLGEYTHTQERVYVYIYVVVMRVILMYMYCLMCVISMCRHVHELSSMCARCSACMRRFDVLKNSRPGC